MRSAYLAKQVLALLIAATVLPDVARAETTLRYSDHEPLGGMRTRFMQEVFFPAIESESQGRLKVQAHWGGELAQAYDALGAVKGGKLTDMATTVPEYTAKELPLHQIFKSFPVGPQGEKQIAFFRRTYAEVPEFSAELQQNNLVPIFLATGYPVAFFSTQPVKSLEDIRAHTWRSASFWHQGFLRNAGAIPVSMHWGEEVYKALEARTLDGLMVNVDSGYDLKVYEHAPHVLVSQELWLGHLYPLVMNRGIWNGLAQQDREAIQRAAQTAYTALGAVMAQSFAAQVAELQQVHASVRLLKHEEVLAFQAATKYQEVQAVWVQEQQSKGVGNAAAVLEKVGAILADSMR